MRPLLCAALVLIPGPAFAAPLGVWSVQAEFSWVTSAPPDLDMLEFSLGAGQFFSAEFVVFDDLRPGVSGVGTSFVATSATDPGFDGAIGLLLGSADPGIFFAQVVVPDPDGFFIGRIFDTVQFDQERAQAEGIRALTMTLDRLGFYVRDCSFCPPGQTLYRIQWGITATAVPEPAFSFFVPIVSLFLARRHIGSRLPEDE